MLGVLAHLRSNASSEVRSNEPELSPNWPASSARRTLGVAPMLPSQLVIDRSSSATASGCAHGSPGSTVAASAANSRSTCRMLRWSAAENHDGVFPTNVPSCST